MGDWVTDFRQGLRALRRGPGFAAVAILSIAIGVGANTALFTVTNALLLRPLPYRDADRIAIIWQRSPGLDVAQDWLSTGQYLDIKDETQVFSEVAAAIGVSANFTGAGTPERVDGARVSSSFFPLFGATPLLGRAFTAQEDLPGQPLTMILGNGFWHRRFGGDPGVLGRTVTLSGISLTIVGVMGADFVLDKEVMPTDNGVEHPDFLIPLPLPPGAHANRGGEDYNVFARLGPGVPLAQAQSQMDVVAAKMKQDYPADYPPNGGLTLSVVPLLQQVVGNVRLAIYVLLGAVGFVLLIACANVANLLLSRAAIREKELAVRAALGAGPRELMRPVLAESLLIGMTGGAVGFGFAVAAISVLRHAAGMAVPRLAEVGVDFRVVAFTFGVTLATALVVGLLPSLRASRVDPNAALQEGGRGGVGTSAFGLGHERLRRLLVAGEVALSLVVLTGAGLLVRSYAHILEANPGFDPRNVLSFRLALPGSRYPTPDATVRFYRALTERLRALPGVESVGANYLLPLSSVALGWEPITVEGFVPKAPGEDHIIASSGYIDGDYFPTMGIPVVAGRGFTPQDNLAAPRVAIVDDRLAKRFWPGEDPLGKRLRRGTQGPWATVVGVVQERKTFSAEPEPPIRVYFPLEQLPVPIRYLVIRSSVATQALTASVTTEVHALDPDLPVFDVSTMEQRLRFALAQRRLATVLLGGFALFALTLAGIGIYGVTSYWTGQRTREIGIRRAIGASPEAIQRLVLRQATMPVAAGVVLGLVAAILVTRVLGKFLFGVGPLDPVTFLGVPLLLVGTAFAASFLPARRALRIDPIVAVRQE